MALKELWSELCRGEWEFVANKVRNNLFHNYLPTLQVSQSLPTVLVASSARSGSTWLMELLLKTAPYRVLFEAVPNAEFSLRDFETPRYVLSAGHSLDERTDFVTSLQHCDRRDWSQQHRNSRNIHWLARGVLIKSTRANFCLDFLQTHLGGQTLRVIYLIRNPFDVIRSKILKKSVAGGQFVSKFCYDPLQLFATDDPFFQAYFERYRPLLGNAPSDVQQEAFIWCLENRWLLDVWHERGWSLVVYENLALEFEQTFCQLLDDIGLPFRQRVLASRQVRSSTAYAGRGREMVASAEFRNIGDSLTRWRDFFSVRQQREIAAVMDGFGIDYNVLLDNSVRERVDYSA
ncbi:sulfotransferase domain-containing protein [Parahaliea mediterranea]|uniref:sulfotransferase domain-containing protein n=1 Tax=Parahaliea mediterranea TaxID=651086 RepID=UPI000E2F3CA9|nr:sulfotransferase domain-containing protein [Parahaliea mediterranea]